MPRRPGTAPLEFALVLPLLAVLMTVGWWAARNVYARVSAATTARHDAWAARAEVDPGRAFHPQQPALRSYVERNARQPVPGPSPIDGSSGVADAWAGLTDKTHDFKQFPFPLLQSLGGGVAKIAPHTDQIDHFVPYIPLLGLHAPLLGGFAAMDPRVNPRLVAFAIEGRVWFVKRVVNLATIGVGIPFLVIAEIKLIKAAIAAAAAWNFPLAAWYGWEAVVVLDGIRGSASLLYHVLKP